MPLLCIFPEHMGSPGTKRRVSFGEVSPRVRQRTTPPKQKAHGPNVEPLRLSPHTVKRSRAQAKGNVVNIYDNFASRYPGKISPWRTLNELEASTRTLYERFAHFLAEDYKMHDGTLLHPTTAVAYLSTFLALVSPNHQCHFPCPIGSYENVLPMLKHDAFLYVGITG
jgi:hypothetical protein